MSFANALLAAVMAGALSAQLAGGLMGGSIAGGLFFLIAPLPILLVGMLFVPLAALAAGLIGAVLLALFGAAANPFSYLIVIGLPAYAACWLLLARGQGALFERNGYLNLGSVGFLLTMVIALTSVFVTILAEPDFATFQATNRLIATEAVEMFLKEMPNAQGNVSAAALAESMTTIGPMASMLMIQSVFIFLVYFAARVTRQWNRLQRPWPDFAMTRVPPAGIGIMAASVLLMALGGWTGLFGGYVLVGLIMLMILIGLAVVHYRARLMPQTRWMVPAAWIALLVLSPFMLMLPAMLLGALGIIDHVFDLRGLRRQDGTPPNQPLR